jgi:hypothetical protein
MGTDPDGGWIGKIPPETRHRRDRTARYLGLRAEAFKLIAVHGGQLGSVHFPVSCSAAAAEHAARGLALLHHMTYEAAGEAFGEAVAADSSCAMGYWGEAMSYIHPLWSDPPSEAKFARGSALIDEAGRRGRPADWEREYIGATRAYYVAGRGPREAPNLAALAAAWEDGHRRRPADDEAAAFHALTLLPTADPADTTLAVRRRAGAVAESVLARSPARGRCVRRRGARSAARCTARPARRSWRETRRRRGSTTVSSSGRQRKRRDSSRASTMRGEHWPEISSRRAPRHARPRAVGRAASAGRR